MIAARTLAAIGLLLMLAVVPELTDAHANIRGGNTMAMVVSANAPETNGAMCDDTVSGGCHLSRRLLLREEAEVSSPEFIPTHEWQDIMAGQAIPPGLYIRVNLETGKKEAKLLE